MKTFLQRIDWYGGLQTSFVVGSVLILINQWDALFSSAPFSLPKAVLTYIVPFCVYQYGLFQSQKATSRS